MVFKCRLTKSELGKVSKAILGNINNQIWAQTQVNQWRNTTEAISWFKSIKDKQQKSLISFDIVDFYPSISESFLDRSITWARQITEITPKNITIIKHAPKSLLFHKNHAWSKRNPESTFEVSMGSYDGAEICELVGLFILNHGQKCETVTSLFIYSKALFEYMIDHYNIRSKKSAIWLVTERAL